MARSTFGGFGGDQVSLDPAGNSGFYKAAANYNATGTFWSASTGGTPYTDLVDPITSVALAGVSTDAHGHVVPFKGPDGITEGWLDFGAGRFKVTAVDSGLFITNPPTPGAFNLPMRDSTNTTMAWTTSQASVARALGWVIVTDPAYGAKGDGVTDDTTAITAAVNALPSTGGTVFFPAPPSFYKITSAIPLRIGVTYIGPGRGVCEVRATAGNVFAPTGTKSAVVVQGLTLSAYAAHVIDLGTGSNGLYQSTFRDCAFVAGGNGVSIVNGNGPCAWQEVYVENCVLSRQPGATVPAVNIITSGSGGNGSVWQKLVFINNNATGTPFMHIENSGSGNYLYDNAFRDIVGEQNVGGMIRVLSPLNVTFENITDYDVAGSYTASLIRVGKSATGPFPSHISVKGAGNRGGTINGTTVFQVEIMSSASDVVIERVFDSVGNTYIKTASPTYGLTRIDGWGASGNVRTTTANATCSDLLDGTLVMNGASLTATLPGASAVPYGRKFTIKNINASTLTVSSPISAPTITLGTTATSGGTFAAGTYYWKVTATNALGETVGSNEVTATLVANGTQVLNWTAVAGATGYKVYRATAAGGESTTPALVATLGNVATYTDTGVAVSAGAVPATATAAWAIDGAPSKTLAQWAWMTVLTDSTQWLIVA